MFTLHSIFPSKFMYKYLNNNQPIKTHQKFPTRLINMGHQKGSFLVASFEDSVLVKVEGLAAHTSSLLFKDFVDVMMEKGFKRFIVDLSMCEGMDSAFMGTLVGVTHPTSTGEVVVINANKYHKELLENLGLLHILQFREDSVYLPELTMKRLEDTTYNLERRIKILKETHECLTQLNEKNKRQFGQFLKLLAQEMQP